MRLGAASPHSPIRAVQPQVGKNRRCGDFQVHSAVGAIHIIFISHWWEGESYRKLWYAPSQGSDRETRGARKQQSDGNRHTVPLSSPAQPPSTVSSISNLLTSIYPTPPGSARRRPVHLRTNVSPSLCPILRRPLDTGGSVARRECSGAGRRRPRAVARGLRAFVDTLWVIAPPGEAMALRTR